MTTTADFSNKLATNLATDLSSLGHLIDRIIFANASPRYLLSTPVGYEPQMKAVDPGVAATCLIGGRKFVQVERAATNLQRYSDTFASWTQSTGAVEIAAGSTSPIGTTSARGEDNNVATGAFYYSTGNIPADTNYYCWSIFVKQVDQQYSRVAPYNSGFVSRRATADLVNLLTASSGGVVVASVTDVGGGWRRVMCYDVNTSIASLRLLVYPAYATGLTTVSDALVGKTDYWKAQVELGPYATSPIDVPSTVSVTRAKDEAYIAASSVPPTLRNKLRVYGIPRWSDVQLALGSSSNYLYRFGDSGSNGWGLYFKSSDKKLYFERNGTDIASSDALTVAANSIPVVTADRVAGTITLAGFTGGNGVINTSPWSVSDGPLYVGQDASNNNQFDGLISLEAA